MLTLVPLLVVVVVIYNLLVLAGPGMTVAATENMTVFLERPLLNIPMISKDTWILSTGDLVLMLALVLLFVELVKSTRSDRASMIDHGLSMLLFVVCLVEFIVLRGFATSVFFLITLMTALDVVAGFTISIVSARRDLDVSSGIIGR